MITLKDSKLLHIKTENGIFLGGSQSWYPKRWQRMAGCGATVASNIVWYMTLAQQAKLVDISQGTKEDFIRLMVEMFSCVTPGIGGVNKSTIFVEGVKKYARTRGLNLVFRILEIPKQVALRPNIDQVFEFIASALDEDLPVAFLNLHNGKEKNLDSWHWVTILEVDCEKKLAIITDQGKELPIGLESWLLNTKLGGALVALSSH